MLTAEWHAAPDVQFLTPDQPPPVQDSPEEPWLPARDVTLMTLAAYALIALATLTEFAQ
jgi:hypothetical protein